MFLWPYHMPFTLLYSICTYIVFLCICNIFSDLNDRNTMKTENIFTPMQCFKGEMHLFR